MLELTINPDWQSQPFVITGNAEAVMPLAEAAQAHDKALPVHRAPKAGNKLIQAATQATEGFAGRLAVNVKTVAYDKIHGTSMYEQLRQKRSDERDVRFAASIGLLTLGETMCAKHKHAVDSLKA